MTERRTFFARLASAMLALGASRPGGAQQTDPHAGHKMPNAAPPAGQAHQHGGAPGATAPAADPHAHHRMTANLPVHTPDLPKLEYKLVDGVKEFRLIAEVVQTELMPGGR
jgi:hypothetical protein